MSLHYMSVAQVASFLGLERSTVSRLNLPEPDAYIGNTRGWKPETITDWAKTRPTRNGRAKTAQQ